MKNSISQDGTQVIVVNDYHSFIDSHYHGVKNAICWDRTLEGDFEEIVQKLILKKSVTEIVEDDLMKLDLSVSGQIARNQILQDLRLLTENGNQPVLNLIRHYERDDRFDFISTDVYSYHVDRSPIGTDTILCTYYGEASDILPNDQAIQKIRIPEIREQLMAIHDEGEDSFQEFLEVHYFDMHYAVLPGAIPIYMKRGQLWRIAVDSPDLSVAPCIHRAPDEKGQLRLLLIC